MKKCKWCGKEYSDEATVCANDAHELAEIDAPSVPQQEVDDPHPSRVIRPVPITLICVLAGIANLVGILDLIRHGDLMGENGAYILLRLAMFAVLVGLWRLRRWAAYTILALCIVSPVFGIVTGRMPSVVRGSVVLYVCVKAVTLLWVAVSVIPNWKAFSSGKNRDQDEAASEHNH